MGKTTKPGAEGAAGVIRFDSPFASQTTCPLLFADQTVMTSPRWSRKVHPIATQGKELDAMTSEKQITRGLRLHALEIKTGDKRSTLYARMNPKSKYFDPTFPQRRRSGSRSVFWLEHEVDAWLASRPIVSASISHEVAE